MASCAPLLRAQGQDQTKLLAREIFKQLIEINTTDSVGDVTTAAEAMAKRLRDAGFSDKDIVVAGPNERKKNLVARIHGTGKRKPLLFIAHLDVVEAHREDWSTDPFQFLEKDNYFYGRGTQDIKDGDAILMTNFIRLKKEGFQPDRDLIVALTADEEGGSSNGIDWLIKHHRDWIDAEYCVNLDGGDFFRGNGKKIYAAVQVSEKVYVSFQFEVRNPGGHSSLPTRDNAIYHLAEGLTRLKSFDFPVDLSPVTRLMLERSAALNAAVQTPSDSSALARLSETPFYNAILRTTCVPTMLSGGHAENALPQMARATVNCRILPGEDPQKIRETLVKVVADSQIYVSFVEQRDVDGKAVFPTTVPPSPLQPELMSRLEETVHSMTAGLPLLLVMDTGASDGKYLRAAGIPTYGVSGVFLDVNDVRAHGKDERVGVQDFYDGVEFNYKLIKALSAPR
jgi:acetylornithine deacetylase/succinyl-diaminopimelate desuccinylase-like protein